MSSSDERWWPMLPTSCGHSLANVRGYLEAAQDDVVPTDDELLSSLLEETLHLQRLIDDLQDLALADAGRLPVHLEVTDAGDLDRQVVAASQPAATQSQVELLAEAESPVPLLADPARLRQVIANLVANALRYTPPGGRVGVRVDRVAGTPPSVRIVVVDTGIGIEAEHLPHVFERFYRADASRSRDTGGSGLGLAITRSLVEAHGGTIDVQSTAGVGTAFTILLPTPVASPGYPNPSRSLGAWFGPAELFGKTSRKVRD